MVKYTYNAWGSRFISMDDVAYIDPETKGGLMNRFKKYSFLITCIIISVALAILHEVDTCFVYPLVAFLFLDCIIIVNMNALKPGLFGGAGVKYWYQRKDNLAGYKKLIQKVEFVAFCIASCALTGSLIFFVVKSI